MTRILFVVLILFPVLSLQSRPKTGFCKALYYGYGNGDGVLNRRCFQLQAELSQAAWDGDLKKIKNLIQRGANADSSAGEYLPPLFAAASQGQTDAVALLLDNGAKIDRKYTLNGSPLFGAIDGNHLETVAVLLSRGANVNLSNGNETPLKIARSKKHERIASLLQQYGAKE